MDKQTPETHGVNEYVFTIKCISQLCNKKLLQRTITYDSNDQSETKGSEEVHDFGFIWIKGKKVPIPYFCNISNATLKNGMWFCDQCGMKVGNQDYSIIKDDENYNQESNHLKNKIHGFLERGNTHVETKLNEDVPSKTSLLLFTAKYIFNESVLFPGLQDKKAFFKFFATKLVLKMGPCKDFMQYGVCNNFVESKRFCCPYSHVPSPSKRAITAKEEAFESSTQEKRESVQPKEEMQTKKKEEGNKEEASTLQTMPKSNPTAIESQIVEENLPMLQKPENGIHSNLILASNTQSRLGLHCFFILFSILCPFFSQTSKTFFISKNCQLQKLYSSTRNLQLVFSLLQQRNANSRKCNLPCIRFLTKHAVVK